MGILPVATFCSGHTFFVQHMADVLGLEPYVVHATFQFSGTPGKRHRMREALLWDAVSLGWLTLQINDDSIVVACDMRKCSPAVGCDMWHLHQLQSISAVTCSGYRKLVVALAFKAHPCCGQSV